MVGIRQFLNDDVGAITTLVFHLPRNRFQDGRHPGQILQQFQTIRYRQPHHLSFPVQHVGWNNFVFPPFRGTLPP